MGHCGIDNNGSILLRLIYTSGKDSLIWDTGRNGQLAKGQLAKIPTPKILITKINLRKVEQ
jgi:hypothetical protein